MDGAINLEPAQEQPQWHYVLNGVAVGPVSVDELKDLFTKNILTADSLIWKKGFEGWKRIEDTELKEAMEARQEEEEEEDKTEWHYDLNGDSIGPVSANDIKNLITNKTLNADSFVWTAGFEDWTKIQDTELRETAEKEYGKMEWYYEMSGERKGPVPAGEINYLISSSILNKDSVVWKPGFEDWKKIKDTEFKAPFGNDIPPLPQGKVNNDILWLLAFAPLIGSLVKIVLFYNGIKLDIIPNLFMYAVINTLLAIWDDARVRDAGYKPNTLVWILTIVAVYIWKRIKLTKQSESFFWINIVAWFMSIIINVIIRLTPFPHSGDSFKTDTFNSPSPAISYATTDTSSNSSSSTQTTATTSFSEDNNSTAVPQNYNVYIGDDDRTITVHLHAGATLFDVSVFSNRDNSNVTLILRNSNNDELSSMSISDDHYTSSYNIASDGDYTLQVVANGNPYRIQIK